MKATDLRISNLILYNSDFNGGEKWDVVDVDIETLSWALSNQEQFNRVHKPIKLTEEWLLKLGFNKSHHGYVELTTNNINFTFDENGLDVAFSGCTSSQELPHIKYVHQLQNIIFALTGEELKSKE